MKKLIGVLILLMIAVLMVLTRPDKQRHQEAMLSAIEAYIDEESKDKLGDNMLAEISKGVVIKTAETALNLKLRENNYQLFNTTYVRLQGKDQILSLGILGMVFTFDKDMIREKLEEAMKVKEEAETEKEKAKRSARELKQLEKEKKKREKELRKEAKRKAKEEAKAREAAEEAAEEAREAAEEAAEEAAKKAEKEAKRKAKEAAKEAKRKAKEEAKAAKEASE